MDITIRGYVQGVGFRYFVQQSALVHGVTGEVWNSQDGSVRMIAQHLDKNVLKRFAELMHDGPGRVDEVFVAEAEDKEFTTFRIVKRD